MWPIAKKRGLIMSKNISTIMSLKGSVSQDFWPWYFAGVEPFWGLWQSSFIYLLLGLGEKLPRQGRNHPFQSSGSACWTAGSLCNLLNRTVPWDFWPPFSSLFDYAWATDQWVKTCLILFKISQSYWNFRLKKLTCRGMTPRGDWLARVW